MPDFLIVKCHPLNLSALILEKVFVNSYYGYYLRIYFLANTNMFSTMVETGPDGPSQITTVGGRYIGTWPRAHLSQRSLSDLQYRIQLERAIKLAKKHLEEEESAGASKEASKQQQDEQHGTYYRELLGRLLRALELIRDTKNEQLLLKAGRGRRRRKISTGAKAEPHFGSMILYGTLQKSEGKALQRGMALRNRRESIQILSDDVPSMEDEEEGIMLPDELTAAELEEPFLLRYSALMTSLLSAFLLLFLGALLFQAIDADIGAHPFHRALLFTFQAVGTIGWGDLRATNKWSQAVCTIYTIFGVPMFFSAVANVGRFISEFYTVDWLFLTCVVRPTSGTEPLVQQHVSIRKSLYLLCIHQSIGVLLYGGLLKEYSPISVIYFCMTSMATIGIGDFHPDAANLAESLVAIVFMSVGMVLLAALLIAFAYHFQVIFFVHLRGWLLRMANARK